MTTAKDTGSSAPQSKPVASRAQSIRDHSREELIREITAAARRQLAEVGAAALSMRAITRDLGMAPSAIYRYFSSRDALLTELISQAYHALASTALNAEKKVDRTDFLGRWLTTFRAVRAWAKAHPYEYALIYGSPIPGYVAPATTAEPASKVVLCLARITIESLEMADLDTVSAQTRDADPLITSNLVADTQARIYDLFQTPQQTTLLPELSLDTLAAASDPELVLRVLDSWTQLFGMISFELFGHYRNVINANDDYFDRVATQAARNLGITGELRP